MVCQQKPRLIRYDSRQQAFTLYAQGREDAQGLPVMDIWDITYTRDNKIIIFSDTDALAGDF